MAQIIKANQANEGDPQQAGLPVRAVLNLRDLAAQARDIILDARKEASAIVAKAKAQAGEIKAQASHAAQAEGYAQGLAQARADAQAQLQAQTAELVDVSNAIVGVLAAARDQTLARMRRDMLNLSLQLASKIVGQVAVSDIAAARANMEKVLELCSPGGEIVLKVNPRQLRRLQEHCLELTAALAVQGTVRMIGDEAVGPGGVKLISGGGEIDATIETQLANLAKSIVGGMGGLFEQAPEAQGAYVAEVDASTRGTAVSAVCSTGSLPVRVPPVFGQTEEQQQRNGEDRAGTALEHMGRMPMSHAGKMPATHEGETPATHEGGLPATQAYGA